MLRRTLAVALLCSATALNAAPILHPLFSDNSVLQRGQPISIWGSAQPGEKVKVSLGQETREVATDRKGNWRATLPPMGAGGPYALTVTGRANSRVVAKDILIGDVWLCSGQSNMELPLSRSLNSDAEIQGAQDLELRLLTIPKRTSLSPEAKLPDAVEWKKTTPENVTPFSAACYFMARDLRKTQKVPIGAINASWGGTQIRAWLDQRTAMASGGEDAALLMTYARDPQTANRLFGERWQKWWTSKAEGEPWRNSMPLAWQPMPSISFWENWGDPAFASFNGMVWARRKITLTPEEAAAGGTLSLGVIDELDQTWVNGVPVGNTFGWDNARDYRLPKELLRAGENEIIVNLFDNYGFGGFQGPADKLVLSLANGTTKSLGEGWEYAVAKSGIGDPPRPPWDSNAGLSLIHNAMIAPLQDFRISGVAWYQGESDVADNRDYAAKLLSMMEGWRRQFRTPNLPFLIVSLANYGSPATAPRASGWAELREQQRLAAERDPNAALVIAMDLGERQDIHPTNKQEVGRRLARAARSLAYDNAEPASGPEAVAASLVGDAVVVEFKGVSGGLQTWSGTNALAFELCGATQESCRFATARASGSSVRIATNGQSAARVRYAWGENPIINLYDEALLPAGPFELPIR